MAAFVILNPWEPELSRKAESAGAWGFLVRGREKMTVEIAHDGFARQSLVRETIRQPHADGRTCDWCGQNPHGRLFRYGNQPESISGRIDWDGNHLFCSVGCYRSYHA